MGIEVNITDNSKEYLAALDDAVERALEACGIQAEGHAKVELSNTPKRIDTGLLRNSITHAVSGKPAAISHYKGSDKHTAESASAVKRGLVGKAAPPPHEGSYSGQAPDEKNKAVWIGTNVEYAPYVHDGTSKMAANRFLKNAVVKHKDEYKAIIEQQLKNG